MCLYVESVWLNLLQRMLWTWTWSGQWKGTLGDVFSVQDSLNLGLTVWMTEVWTLHSEMGFTFPTPQGFPEESD